MSIKNQHNEERGFALVMTMAILTGMLIIIVPLVMINNTRASEANALEAQTFARFGIETGKNLTHYVSDLNGGASQCAFARTASLPGWRDIPIRLYTADGSKIANMLPAFLMMAQPLGNLNNTLDEGGAKPGTSAWVMIGGELMSANRGIAGVKSSHPAGAQYFGLDKTVSENAWVRVNGEWSRVGTWSLNDDLSGSFSFPDLTKAIPDDATIEFYPTRVEEATSGSNLDINIQIIDERSKININSMPDGLATLLNIKPNNRGVPYVAPGELEQDGVADENITNNLHLITSNSSPDYSLITHDDLYGVVADRGAFNGVPNKDGFMNNNKSRMYQHPINVNTAEINVLGKVFQDMGIVANAYVIARAIAKHRNGPGDAFDGNENPFDGKNGNTYFASPADEFHAFLKTEGFDVADIKKIMQHVYADGNLTDYASLGNDLSVPLCFQRDLVQTAVISARIRNGIKPVAEEKYTMTYKDNYSSKIVENEIVLDSNNGWNASMSTFKGIEWRQPTIVGNGVGNNVASGDFQFFNTGGWSESSSMSPGIVGYIGNNSLYAGSMLYDNEILKVVFSDGGGVSDVAFDNTEKIDFGLRVMANTNLVQNIQGVDVTAANAGQYTLAGGQGFHAAGGIVAYVPDPNSDDGIISAAYSTFENNTLTSNNAALIAATAAGLPAGAKMYPMPSNNEIYASPDYDDLYQAEGTDPYYETVLIRENVTWKKVEWWCAPNDGLPADQAAQVKTVNWVGYNINTNNSVSDTITDNNGASDGFNGKKQYHSGTFGNNGTESQFMRLKFNFNELTNTTGKTAGGCPQIYKIRVTYTKTGQNHRIILSSH